MSMMLVLALAAQSVTLPTDTREAAITCAAVVRVDADSTSNEPYVISTWMLMAAAKATGGGLMTDTLPPLLAEAQKRKPALSAQKAALLPQCRQRFPKAWKSSGVTLPSDNYERLMLCFSTSSLLEGMYRDGPSENDHKRAAAMSDRLGPPLLPELDKHGITNGDMIVARMSDSLSQSLDLGNVAGIFAACEAAFPA